MSTQLDPFETRLLAELRDYVAETSGVGPGLAGRPRHFGPSRIALRVAAAAAAVAAILVVPGLGTSPAYSVGEGNAGEVNVDINRPEDAAGLEQALEDHGITANITYLPELQSCAPGRYTVVDRETNVMASIGERHISVTLAPDTVRDGETFVLTWSVVPMTDEEMEQIGSQTGERVTDGFSTTVEFDVATGAVAACQPIAKR
jgi:hypothetical protein